MPTGFQRVNESEPASSMMTNTMLGLVGAPVERWAFVALLSALPLLLSAGAVFAGDLVSGTVRSFSEPPWDGSVSEVAMRHIATENRKRPEVATELFAGIDICLDPNLDELKYAGKHTSANCARREEDEALGSAGC